MITTTEPLSFPESLAREKRFVEVEAWNTVLKMIAADLRCSITTENRLEKRAKIYRRLDSHLLGTIWVNYSGVICYEVNHLSVSRNKVYQACNLKQALTQVISHHF